MIRGVIGSVVKMVSYDLTVIANLPGMDEWKFLETASMFKMLSPCEIVTRGHTFVFNTSLLFVLAMTSILFALAVSTQRDLPKDSPLKKSWPSVKAIEYAIRITQDGKGNESFENRNLLFALLALQLNFVNCEQLVAVMEAWLHDRSSSIGDFFV